MRQGTLPIFALVALYLAGVGAAAQIAKIIPVFGYLTDDIGITLPQATLVMSAIGFAAVLLGSMAGRAVVDLGLWRVMCLACALAIGAGLVLPLAGSMTTLLSLRVIEGLSHIAIVAAAPTLMMALVPKSRAPLIMGVWATFFGVAFGASQAFALTGLADTAPAAFLRWHVILFVPAVFVAVHYWRAHRLPAPRIAAWPLLPTELSREQLLVSGVFMLHAGLFTSMLAFAQTRIGGDAGAALAPILPLLSLAAAFLGAPILLHAGALTIFVFGTAFVSVCLTLAWFHNPLLGYMGAFLGVGWMQVGVFAFIGELAKTQEEGSATNGAYTQLGNAGNIAIPYVVSATLTGWLGGQVELMLLLVVAGLLSLILMPALQVQRHEV